MTSSFNPRHILTISDIHLGHKNTPTAFILKNLETFFKNFGMKDNFDGLKVIFFAGDMWDEVVTFGDEFLADFIVFWYKFCSWCVRKKIKVRLLKGTPRHDGNQGSSVESYTLANFPQLDFKYIKTLSVEVIEDLKLSVLYVPDEWRPTADAVYQDALAALHEAQLNQVDIAVMHGMFKYQLGTIPMNNKVHDETHYLALVKGFISIGHIHTASRYERIYAQGSFDRTAHNEEGDKGAFYHVETSPGTWEPFFLVNQHAKQYKSVEIKKSTKDALAKIDKVALSMPDFSHLRIVAEEGHDILQGIETLVKKYPALKITKKTLSSKQKQQELIIRQTYVPLILNKETLTESIFQEVTLKHTLSPEESKRLFKQLEDLHI